MTMRPRDPLRLAVCVLFTAAFLKLPWPLGQLSKGQTVATAVIATTRELHATAARSLAQAGKFQSQIETPGSGEYVLPGRVQEMLSILRKEGRGVKRYALSPRLAEDLWTFQVMVSSAWPLRLEPAAKARFVLSVEGLPTGCFVVGRREEVLLAYCP